MSDHHALWNCVIANPHDSAPKFVLADWYYERDQELMADCLWWAGRSHRMPARDAHETHVWRWSIFEVGPPGPVELARRMLGPQAHQLEPPIFDLMCLGEKRRESKCLRFRRVEVAFWRLSQALYLYEAHVESLKTPIQSDPRELARLR